MEVEVLNRQVLSHPVVNGSRVTRTREAIIASALALAETGDVAPIVRDIAKMAGVSARTVFQHFADTAELYVAVLDRVLAAGFGDMAEPGAALSLEGRVQLVVDRAADRYERLLPMWTFVETLQRRSPPAADMIAQVYATNQANLARWFDRELAATSRRAARADAECARPGARARELGRAAPAARPLGRAGARRAALRLAAAFTGARPAASAALARCWLRPPRQFFEGGVAQPEFAQMGDRVAQIVDVGAGGAAAAAHQGHGLRDRQLAGELPVLAVGEIDQRLDHATVVQMDRADLFACRRRRCRSRASDR